MTKLKEVFIKFDAIGKRFICQNEWILPNIAQLKRDLKKISWPAMGNLVIDGHAVSKMDSAGAWLLDMLFKRLRDNNISIQLQNFSEQQQRLLALIEKQIAANKEIPRIIIPHAIARLGKRTIEQLQGFHDFLQFVGELTCEALRVLGQRARVRWRDIASVIEKAGYQALPIIALLSFMIGVVICYQMGNQLRKYGANVFVVDLLGYSILREFGPLLTAIMVAGRTGSAFTAQLGTMKIHQEIDALNTMGVTPADLLLLPRMLGLFLVMPLLTMWADFFGLVGGMMMAHNMLNISGYEFLHRFQSEIPMRALLIGLGKAPVFALLIGSIGCFQGMQVQGSADSVGKRTTRSVVLAIFFIILVDAGFSVLLSKLKL